MVTEKNAKKKRKPGTVRYHFVHWVSEEENNFSNWFWPVY
jgi:hypothetical protein